MCESICSKEDDQVPVEIMTKPSQTYVQEIFLLAYQTGGFHPRDSWTLGLQVM
jgi:hypothetical protein